MSGARGQAKMVILEDCRHTALFNPPPIIGDAVWCRRCQSYRSVGRLVDEWTIRCFRCNLSRAYGEDEQGARAAVGRHRLRYTGHVVALSKGPRLVETFGVDERPDYLQWVDSHPLHQGSLRALTDRSVTET